MIMASQGSNLTAHGQRNNPPNKNRVTTPITTIEEKRNTDTTEIEELLTKLQTIVSQRHCDRNKLTRFTMKNPGSPQFLIEEHARVGDY